MPFKEEEVKNITREIYRSLLFIFGKRVKERKEIYFLLILEHEHVRLFVIVECSMLSKLFDICLNEKYLFMN